MTRNKIETCWSRDGENFNSLEFCDILDDLRSDLDDEEIVGLVVYKAEAHTADGTNLIAMDDIILLLSERAYDNYGERAEDWPDPSTGAVKKLEKYICNWIKKECPCNFWVVKNVQEYVITAEDIA